ncbi:hypothetical protein NNC19_22095 [Clostridium sp. SHJSY1]|uniref:hypothetical protein n=1 Tax=Clostridium sp. SHJSY1 TaxID=2942483 RepID=UPI00287579F8|nr:hypothetical protein [Clostridium sp. SHJSY1]MDS0528384.1 hypothetical protein [Clostridium sp. SHJSY1]
MKKIISIVMSALMTASLISCGKTETKTETKTEESSIANSEEKYSNLQGDWVVDFTSDNFNAKYTDLLKKVEDKTKSMGFKYEKKEVVREENENYLSFENDKAQKDELQGLNFGRKIFGNDLSSGQITMKILYNFDGKKALNNSKFDFGDTPVAKYAALFTNQSERDYSEINKKIKETLNSEKGEGVIKSQVNGLYEEFTVNKEYMVYVLETKKYEFVKPNQ